MKFINSKGYKEVVAESDKEEVLCDWINVDVQNEPFVIEEAEGLCSMLFTREAPMIGNRYKAFSENEKIFISKSPVTNNDCESFTSYNLDEVKRAIELWKDYLK